MRKASYVFKAGRADLVPGLSCPWALGTGWKLTFLRSGLAGKDGALLLPHVSTVCFCARMCPVQSQISGFLGTETEENDDHRGGQGG